MTRGLTHTHARTNARLTADARRSDALLIIAPAPTAFRPARSSGLKAGARASSTPYIILDLRSPTERVVLTIQPLVTVDSAARPSINKEEDPGTAFVIKHRVIV